MSIKKISLGFVAALALAGVPASAAVVNGDFESVDSSPGLVNGNTALNALTGTGNASWNVYTAIPGWTTTYGNGIEIQTNGTLGTIDSMPGGSHYVELDSHPGPKSNSAMEQTLNLLQGRYRLDFWYSPRNSNADSNGIRYQVTGSLMNSLLDETVTGPSTGQFGPITVGDWTQISGFFTVDKDQSVKLKFSARGTKDTLGGFLDNVRVSAVPVPASLPLLLAGLAGLGFLRRRRAA